MNSSRFYVSLVSLLTAFAASAQMPSYTVTDLGPVGPFGQPFNVSNNSLAAGDALMGNNYHSILWYRGQQIDIGKFGFGGPNSVSYSVNVRAQVVGQAETSVPDPYGEDFCGFGTNLVCLPYIWQNGLMIPLPTLRGKSGVANWINAQGQIVGAAENTAWDYACPPPQRFQFRPVMWVNGTIQELPLVNGDPVGIAYSINDNGQIAGASGQCSTYSPYYLANIVPTHALLWQNGAVTDLGSLGGTGKFGGNIAFAVNNKGQVVGNSDLTGDTANHGFIWQNGHMTDMGMLPGDVGSASLAINDIGDVVGVSLDQNFNVRGFVWRNNAMVDLNSLVPPDSPLYIELACSINARGEIVGQGIDKTTGELRGYMLTPGAGPANGSISPALREGPRPAVLPEDVPRSHVGRFGIRSVESR